MHRCAPSPVVVVAFTIILEGECENGMQLLPVPTHGSTWPENLNGFQAFRGPLK